MKKNYLFFLSFFITLYASLLYTMNDNQNIEVMCSICRDQIEEHHKKIIFHPHNPVQHIFHEECLTPWVCKHGSCPFDKEPITYEFFFKPLSLKKYLRMFCYNIATGMINGMNVYFITKNAHKIPNSNYNDVIKITAHMGLSLFLNSKLMHKLNTHAHPVFTTRKDFIINTGSIPSHIFEKTTTVGATLAGLIIGATCMSEVYQDIIESLCHSTIS